MIGFELTEKSVDLFESNTDMRSWLRTAIAISLFTDARCSDDELPDSDASPRGYWGDMELPGDETLGSKLWLIDRRKITSETLAKAREYCDDALKWLVDGNHLEEVFIQVERLDTCKLAFLIKCSLPDGAEYSFEFQD